MVLLFMQNFFEKNNNSKKLQQQRQHRYMDLQTLLQYSFISGNRTSVFLLENYPSSILIHVIWE